MFSLLGNLIAKWFYTIMLKIYYRVYKHIFYMLFKFNVIDHNLNIIVLQKDGTIGLSIEQKTIDIINKNIQKNEEYKKNFNTAAFFIFILNKWFIPYLQKYLKASIKEDYKTSKYIGKFINNFIGTCTYKNNRLVDKIIVSNLRKAKFDSNSEEDNKNKRKFILDNLIVFSQISVENYPNVMKVEFEEEDFKDINILINKLMNIQILRPYYIAEYVKENRMDEKNKLSEKMSNSFIHKIRHNLGFDIDVKNMKDYEIIDSIMKTL